MKKESRFQLCEELARLCNKKQVYTNVEYFPYVVAVRDKRTGLNGEVYTCIVAIINHQGYYRYKGIRDVERDYDTAIFSCFDMDALFDYCPGMNKEKVVAMIESFIKRNASHHEQNRDNIPPGRSDKQQNAL